MKKTHRLLYLLPVLCLCVFAFSGCSDAPAAADPSVLLPALVSEQDTGLGEHLVYCTGVTAAGGQLYITGTGPYPADADSSITEGGSWGDLVICAAADGSGARCIPLQMPTLPVPEELDGRWGVSPGLDRLLADKNGSLYGIIHASYTNLDSSVYEPETRPDNAAWLVCWNGDGAVETVLPLAGQIPTDCFGSFPESAAADDKYLWLCSGTQLLRLAKNGREQERFTAPQGYWDSLHPLADGKLLLLGFAVQEGGFSAADRIACIFDPAADAATESIPVPEVLKTGFTLRPVLQSGSTAADILVWNENALWQWDTAAGTAVPLVRWLDSGIPHKELHAVLALKDGKYLAVLQAQADQSAPGLPAGQPLRLCTLTPADSSMLEGRTLITVGCTGSAAESIAGQVLTFNRSNPEAYAQLIDYGSFDLEENNWSGGAAALENDIIRGAAPDILFLPNGTNNNSFIRKGLFIDLYPLLDADPGLAREDFFENLLQACEFNGTLATVVPAYRIHTLAAPADKVSPGQGWSWQEYEALLAQYPDTAAPIAEITPQTALWYTVLLGGSRFIDYEAGQAHLDSAEFIRAMENAAKCGGSANDTVTDFKAELSLGRAVLKDCNLWSFTNMRQLAYEFENGVAFKGYPNEDSSCGSAMVPDLRIGITKDCRSPETAWQFVRQFLLPAFQNSLQQQTSGSLPSFPLRKSALEAAAKAAAVPARNIGWHPAYLDMESLTGEQQRYWKRGITQAECQQITELIGSIDTVFQFDGSLYDILSEEAAVYFAGQRSAAETAAILQNRVQTWLDEQG